MKQIEIEQKYILHPHRIAELRHNLRLAGVDSVLVRQYYEHDKSEKEWQRYRRINENCVLEVKDNINIGQTYSIARERSMPIPKTVWKAGWRKSKKRVTKLRFEPSQYAGPKWSSQVHTVAVDVFLTTVDENALDFDQRYTPYAVVAEIETIWTSDTKQLDLDFKLPKGLEPFVILKVDRTQAYAKRFSAINMCDDPKSIADARVAMEAFL